MFVELRGSGLALLDVPVEHGFLHGLTCEWEPRGFGLPPLGVPAVQDSPQDAVERGPDALADAGPFEVGPMPPDVPGWQGESSTGLFRQGSRFALGRTLTEPDPLPGKPTTARIVRRGVLAAVATA
ncbi:hypothetical protein [Actinomadura chibensis]|uniref:Uncharacterized protein n=1 Tax=Actinomadura chibensis TaxID=392828 RepID=A0A5D0NY68_9ACTN|nr:hypothetical protein [Actinomadura chibensis]TYB49118.1 hypothetical protein FXF69_08275 [Actinomadura chibensis]